MNSLSTDAILNKSDCSSCFGFVCFFPPLFSFNIPVMCLLPMTSSNPSRKSKLRIASGTGLKQS